MELPFGGMNEMLLKYVLEFRLSLPAGDMGKVYLSSTLIIIIMGVSGSKREQGCIQQSGS